MNSKQRVQAAINRKPVDKVPLGLFIIDYDTVARIIGHDTFVNNSPAQFLAFHEGRRSEVAASMKADFMDLYRKLDIVDLITCRDAILPRPDEFDPKRDRLKCVKRDTYEDGQGRIFQLDWSSNDVRCLTDPAHLAPEEYTPAMFPIPESEPAPADDSEFEIIDALVAMFGKERYISGDAEFEVRPLLGGIEQGLLCYGLCPDAVAACARRNTAIGNLGDARMIRKGVDGVLVGQDLGGTQSLLISPAQFRAIILPNMRERVAHIKQFVPHIIFHCCGRTTEIMEDLIECGIDCYQSLQTGAGMAPELLCPRFGSRMTFWGGAPVERLISGSPEEMRQAVHRCMEATAPYPGFIFGPSHSIAYGTKYDNFMAMLDEFERCRDRQ